MAGSVNKVILIGNLGADPEIRRTQDGRPIANLRIATSESWRDKATGERKEKTEWHRVVIFSEGLCKIVEQYLKKGSKVYIEGQLQTRKYNDKDGVEKYSTEVVLQNFNSTLTMLDTRGGGGGGGMSDSDDSFGSPGRDPGAQARDGGGGRQARRHGRRDSVLSGSAAPLRGELEIRHVACTIAAGQSRHSDPRRRGDVGVRAGHRSIGRRRRAPFRTGSWAGLGSRSWWWSACPPSSFTKSGCGDRGVPSICWRSSRW